ncbi:unnamed protein product [Orchesella dallaii]|uniref:Galectin n=1 Tax=Orchesella dallaii TaxID=48710 RepID=A0ABP1PI86_9HEXA
MDCQWATKSRSQVAFYLQLQIGLKSTYVGSYGWRETAGGIFLFHFDMRFPKAHVVTDAQIDGPGWLGYQITNFTSHFRKGNDFLVEIICEKDKFHVMVDGDYFLEYKYKLPLKIADILHLSGVQERDVQVYSVDVNNLSNATKWVYPSAKTNFDLNESGTSDYNCTCDSESPFLLNVTMLDNGLSVGDKITVNGRTLPDAFRFSINIHHSWINGREIILFHFNPRFDEPNVIFDTLNGPGWTKIGRRYSGIYFNKGNNFTSTENADMLEVHGVRDRDFQVFSISLSNPSKDTISFSGIDKADLNLCESDTSANNV